jgi:hypothetical protein
MQRLTALAVLTLIVALPALASVRAYAPRDLRQQWERAKHVALVRVTTVRKLGDFDRDRWPLGPCGVLYGFEVVEQFKGELPRKTAFGTHRILFPERPLRVDEEALVFLRDLRIRQSLDTGIQHELDAAAEAIAKCGAMETTLYVAMSEENVFPLISTASVYRGGSLWLEYRDTSMPGGVEPRLEGKCEPFRDGGCRTTQHPRVAWPSVRALLESWAGR